MSDIRIDDRTVAALVAVGEIADADFAKLIAMLPSLQAGPEVFSRQVASVTALTPWQVSEIFIVALRISYTALDTFANARDTTDEVIAAAAREGTDLTEPEQVADRFERLASQHDMRVRAEAIRLNSSHGRPCFVGVSIVPDMRPVMLDDEPDELAGMFVVHAFRLEAATSNGERRDSHMTLARSDLHTIRAAIDKALAQEDSLVTNMLDRGMVHISLPSAA